MEDVGGDIMLTYMFVESVSHQCDYRLLRVII